jgi:hypothetical protein
LHKKDGKMVKWPVGIDTIAFLIFDRQLETDIDIIFRMPDP